MGRIHKPTAIKIKLGTDKVHKERRAKHEPDAPSGKPRCPAKLSKIEKAEWHKMCKILSGLGLLSPAYERSLEMYVAAYAKYRAAMDELDRTGLLIEKTKMNGDREMIRNPVCSDAHKYHDEVARWLREFGLTPSAKAGVNSERKASAVVSSRKRA